MNFSLEHSVFTINGHRVEGWASASDALMLPAIEAAVTEVGADGKMVAASTGNRGGEVTVKLLPVSRSAAFLMQQAAQIQRGRPIEFNAELENRQNGVTTLFRRGVMTSYPAGQTLGNEVPPALEFTVTFEQIISNYDAARFDGPPPAYV